MIRRVLRKNPHEYERNDIVNVLAYYKNGVLKGRYVHNTYVETVEEFLKFADIPYNSYEVIYDKIEQPTDDKPIFQTKIKIYLNDGYAYLTIHGTATRY